MKINLLKYCGLLHLFIHLFVLKETPKYYLHGTFTVHLFELSQLLLFTSQLNLIKTHGESKNLAWRHLQDIAYHFSFNFKNLSFSFWPNKIINSCSIIFCAYFK